MVCPSSMGFIAGDVNPKFPVSVVFPEFLSFVITLIGFIMDRPFIGTFSNILVLLYFHLLNSALIDGFCPQPLL